jgi:hypothetical protein
MSSISHRARHDRYRAFALAWGLVMLLTSTGGFAWVLLS